MTGVAQAAPVFVFGRGFQCNAGRSAYRMCMAETGSKLATNVEEGSMAENEAKEGVRLPYVLRHFDVAYLGICAPHVWIYCVAHRAGLDFGGVITGIPLYIALSAFMLVVMLLAWKGKAQRVAPKLDWPLAALQA
mgnify:CR=1 FL=1